MKLSLFILLITLTVVPIWSQYMPEGYENIHLGMTREELRVARPNVTGLNLGLDPYVEHPSGALTESKPHMNESEVSEEMIMYGFNDTLLNSVSYVKQLASGAKFLQNQLKKNGRYDEIRMSSTTRYGMIKWIIQDEIYIYLSLPIDWSMSRNSWIGHQVMDTNVAQEFESEIAKALDKKGYDEVAFESFKARVAAFAEKTLAKANEEEIASEMDAPPQSASKTEATAEKAATTSSPVSTPPEPAPENAPPARSPWLWLGIFLVIILAGAVIHMTRR